MSLRWKIFSLVAIVAVALVFGTSYVARQTILGNVQALENQFVHREVERATGAILTEISSLQETAAEWAGMPELASFLDTRDGEFLRTRLGNETLRKSRLNLLVLCMPDGSVVFGRTLTSSGAAGVPPAQFLAHLEKTSLLRTMPESGKAASGIVMLNAMPVMIVAVPIGAGKAGDPAGKGLPPKEPDDPDGPSPEGVNPIAPQGVISKTTAAPVAGVLIAGRYLDEDTVARIGGVTRLSLTAVPSWLGQVGSTGTSRAPARDYPKDVWSAPRNDEVMVGYANIRDIHGKPAMTLCVTVNRDIRKQGIASARYLLISMTFLGLLLVTVTLVAIDRLILTAISDSVSRLRKGMDLIARDAEDLSGRIHGDNRDELGHLADGINEMLKAIEASQKEAAQKQLEVFQSHKMASLGTLVSSVAHEVNNPNNVIMLNAGVLQSFYANIKPIVDENFKSNPDLKLANRRYKEVRDEIPVMIDEISKSSARIAAMIDELKKFARFEDGRASEDIDVNAVVKSALALIRYQIETHTGRLTVRFGADIPLVKGNFQRLEQVVINLLQNACQSLQDKSKGVEITTGHSSETGSVTIVVKDEGRGISPDDIPRIVEPFYTTRKNDGGTGLGLSVSNKIVQDHGGKLTFDSAVGSGTAVTVSLPVA